MNNKKWFYVDFRITPVEHYDNGEVLRRIDDTENDWAVVHVETKEQIVDKIREYMKTHVYYGTRPIPGGYISYEWEITEINQGIEVDPRPDWLILS